MGVIRGGIHLGTGGGGGFSLGPPQNVFTDNAALTEILQAGTGISFEEDDANNELTINRA